MLIEIVCYIQYKLYCFDCCESIHKSKAVLIMPPSAYLVHTELAFLETSALTGENVEEVFLKCTRTILTKIDGGM